MKRTLLGFVVAAMAVVLLAPGWPATPAEAADKLRFGVHPLGLHEDDPGPSFDGPGRDRQADERAGR